MLLLVSFAIKYNDRVYNSGIFSDHTLGSRTETKNRRSGKKAPLNQLITAPDTRRMRDTITTKRQVVITQFIGIRETPYRRKMERPNRTM